MAIGEGGGAGGGGGQDDPYKTMQYGKQYGSSGEVVQDVNRQNMLNQDPNPITKTLGITNSPAYGWTGSGGYSPYGSAGPPNPAIGQGWRTPPFAPGGGDPNANMAPIGGAPNIGGLGDTGYPGYDIGTMEGLDFTQRGALEEYQRQHNPYFNQTTLSEDFARNALAQGAGPGVSNRADEAYQQFSRSNPANMDPYYANARRIAEENIRKTMAARGSYGSSAADDLYNEAYTNLAADQAMKEAQYGLQRGSLLGSLAQGADTSSLAGSSDRRNWQTALSGIAGNADQAGLSRIMGGGNLAGAAQGAQRARGQDFFQNQLAMGDRYSGIMGQGYGNIFGTDLDLMKTAVGLNTGVGAEGYNQASQNALTARQNVANFNNLLGGNMQLANGVYDRFNQSPANPEPSPMPGYYQNPNGESDLRKAWGYP